MITNEGEGNENATLNGTSNRGSTRRMTFRWQPDGSCVDSTRGSSFKRCWPWGEPIQCVGLNVLHHDYNSPGNRLTFGPSMGEHVGGIDTEKRGSTPSPRSQSRNFSGVGCMGTESRYTGEGSRSGTSWKSHRTDPMGAFSEAAAVPGSCHIRGGNLSDAVICVEVDTKKGGRSQSYWEFPVSHDQERPWRSCDRAAGACPGRGRHTRRTTQMLIGSR